jgi:hypothetical protein
MIKGVSLHHMIDKINPLTGYFNYEIINI